MNDTRTNLPAPGTLARASFFFDELAEKGLGEWRYSARGQRELFLMDVPEEEKAEFFHELPAILAKHGFSTRATLP